MIVLMVSPEGLSKQIHLVKRPMAHDLIKDGAITMLVDKVVHHVDAGAMSVQILFIDPAKPTSYALVHDHGWKTEDDDE